MSFLSSVLDRLCLAIYRRGKKVRDAEWAAVEKRREAAREAIFAPFLAVSWEEEPGLQRLARTVFVQLSELDRARAIRWAPVYRARRAATGETQPPAYHWLVFKDWEALSDRLDDDALAESMRREAEASREASDRMSSADDSSPQQRPESAASRQLSA